MEQEATEELVCRQAHQLLSVAVSGVAPTEVDVVIVQCNESVVGDRDAMRVGAEITQNMPRTCTRRSKNRPRRAVLAA